MTARAEQRQQLQHVRPLTISSANCVAATGMCWRRVREFARAHGVPVWRLSHKSLAVPARELFAAMRAAAQAREPTLTFEQELAQVEADFARKHALRDVSTKPE